MAARFKGVGVPWIFFFLSLQIFLREVIFRFRCPQLLTAGTVGAEVAGGAGARTGAISSGLMLMFDKGKMRLVGDCFWMVIVGRFQ